MAGNKSIWEQFVQSFDDGVKVIYDNLFGFDKKALNNNNKKNKNKKNGATAGSPDASLHEHSHTMHVHGSRKALKADMWFTAFYLAFLFFMIVKISDSTGATLGIVFMSFLPTIASVVIIISTFETMKGKALLLGLPILIAFIYAMISGSGLIAELYATEYINIAILNIILSMLFSLGLLKITDVFGGRERIAQAEGNIEKGRHIIHSESHHKHSAKEAGYEIDMEYTDYINNIATGVRKINYAIGRAYSANNGADEEMREKIQINSEWHRHARITDPYDDPARARQLLSRIMHRLHRLYMTEEKLFGDSYKRIKNLSRSDNGSSRIMTVLVHNGNDDLIMYYNRALQSCNAALNMLPFRK